MSGLRIFMVSLLIGSTCPASDFRAGAAIIDVTPEKLPVLVNGGMTSRSLDKIKTRVHARAIVFADSNSQLAIVVVDSCMIGRMLLDDVKALASQRTGIPSNHILISATHAHSAPASMGCLGTDADPDYVPFLRAKLVEVIAQAQSRLQPARIGFGRANAADFTALRQWIRRPDRLAEDPFGNPTVRANMHAGANLDDVTGEAGPEDPELSLISVQSINGQPLAVLANFSMHYFGDNDISADYFGLFSEGLKERIAPNSEFIGMMSHGCSGDIWRRDYTKPESWDPKLSIEDYTRGLLEIAMKAHEQIEYQSDLSIAMSEERMTLKYRVPDKQLLEWSQKVMAEVGDRLPTTQTEVYAREQILLHEARQAEIVVQALRLGSIAIATTPNETYAVTGLKIKAASPLDQTMVIELANGGDGYIPPPEQHPFGGYNTWPARSAGLEVQAEPRIAQAAIRLLERVTETPRRSWELPMGPASKLMKSMNPVAWWRLNEFHGPIAADASGHHRSATIEPGITFFLEGPASLKFCTGEILNRCPHFVGGRLGADIPDSTTDMSITMWVWNGMPQDARNISGWFLSRDYDQGLSRFGEHAGVAGTAAVPGCLIYQNGDGTILHGRTVIPRWTWQHVTFVRSGNSVRLYLNGELEVAGSASAVTIPNLWIGGRSDNDSNWEGRLDEVAVFTRALSENEIRALALQTTSPR